MTDAPTYRDRCVGLFAPETGDFQRALARELAEYFYIPVERALERLDGARERFAAEWRAKSIDPDDERQVIRFYNETATEIFELAEWYSDDRPHHQVLECLDLALERPGRKVLDYGSGIGAAAVAFGLAGFDVTLADISEPLLSFAGWRCTRRGLAARALDLKREPLPHRHFDVVLCLDVLEHVPRPIEVIRTLRDAMVPGGLLFLNAPFGVDPDRPMHIVHDRHAIDRTRSLGFEHCWDLQSRMPACGRSHVEAFRRVERAPFVNTIYFVRDVWLNGSIGDRMSAAFASFRRRRTGAHAG